jgi:hypothetical protein
MRCTVHGVFRTVGVLFLFVTMLDVGGCAGLATVAGDVAGSAVDKTYQLARTGKAESYQPLPIDQVITAVRGAAEGLDLAPVREEKHPDQLKLIYKDQRKLEIVVTVVRRTSRATEIHVDVGLFGVEGMGQLMLRQILRNLAGTDTAATKGADSGW